MTPLKKRFFLTFLAATFASDLCALYLFQSKRIRSAPLIRQAFKIESLGDNVILTKTISMHHPPKKIININQATKRWLQPRWGLQESLETTQVLSTDRSWMTSQCLIKYSCSCGRSKKATDVQQFDTNRWTDKLTYLWGRKEPLSLVYPASPILPAAWKAVSSRLIDWQRSVREKLACRLAQNPWLSPRPVQLLLKRMYRFEEYWAAHFFTTCDLEVNWTKSKRTAAFFRDVFPESRNWFLSDPSPIIGNACQWLTHWLTHWLTP